MRAQPSGIKSSGWEPVWGRRGTGGESAGVFETGGSAEGVPGAGELLSRVVSVELGTSELDWFGGESPGRPAGAVGAGD